MVNYKLAKVRAEIERRRDRHSKAKRIESALEDNAILSFIDSMQEEPKKCMYSKDNFTAEDRKVLCEDCKEKCAYAIAGVISTNAQVKEEPVSEDLEEAVNAYIGYTPEVDESSSTYGKRQAFKAGANWQKQKDSIPVSEDLEAAIDTYLATYFGGEKEKQDWPFLKKMAIHFANWQKKNDDYAIEIAHMAGEEEGKNIMKQQMMAKAVDGFVIEDIEEGNGDFLLSAEYLPKNIGLKDRQKVKVIVIKDN